MGAAFCPTCGSPVAGEIKFCSTCGENLERYEQIVRRSLVHEPPARRGGAGAVSSGPATTVYGVPGPEASPEARVPSRPPPRGVRADQSTEIGLPGPDIHRDPPPRMPEGVSMSSPPPRPSSRASDRPAAHGSPHGVPHGAPPAGVITSGGAVRAPADPSAMGSSTASASGAARLSMPPSSGRSSSTRWVSLLLTGLVVVSVLVYLSFENLREKQAREAQAVAEGRAALAAAAPKPVAPPPPTVELLLPGTLLTDRDHVVIRGRASARSRVWIDGVLTETKDGRFVREVPLTAYGKRTIEVIARVNDVPAAATATVQVDRVRRLDWVLGRRPTDPVLVYRKLNADPAAAVGQRVSFVGTVFTESKTDEGAFFGMAVAKCGPGKICPLWVSHAGLEPTVVGRRVRVDGAVIGVEKLPVRGQVTDVLHVAADAVLPLGKR